MDWSKLITDLEDGGMTQVEIAAACTTSQSYISQLKTGERKTPGWDIGDAIKELHRKKGGPPRRSSEVRPS